MCFLIWITEENICFSGLRKFDSSPPNHFKRDKIHKLCLYGPEERFCLIITSLAYYDVEI